MEEHGENLNFYAFCGENKTTKALSSLRITKKNDLNFCAFCGKKRKTTEAWRIQRAMRKGFPEKKSLNSCLINCIVVIPDFSSPGVRSKISFGSPVN